MEVLAGGIARKTAASHPSGDAVAVIVRAPGADWRPGLADAIRKDPKRVVCLARDGRRHKGPVLRES
jgi:hypothetical protein